MRRTKRLLKSICCLLFYGLLSWNTLMAQQQVRPDGIQFTRQAVRRFLFDKELSIPLSALHPNEVIGMPVMYPAAHRLATHADIQTTGKRLSLQSEKNRPQPSGLGASILLPPIQLNWTAAREMGKLDLNFLMIIKKTNVSSLQFLMIKR